MTVVFVVLAVAGFLLLFCEGHTLLAFIFAACATVTIIYVKSNHTDPRPNKEVKTVECIDFRDNAKFSFTTDNILESGTEFPSFGTWIKVRDNQGTIRMLFDSMHRYIKCEAVTPH